MVWGISWALMYTTRKLVSAACGTTALRVKCSGEHGRYPSSNPALLSPPLAFSPGMVVTCEPGLYFGAAGKAYMHVSWVNSSLDGCMWRLCVAIKAGISDPMAGPFIVADAAMA